MTSSNVMAIVEEICSDLKKRETNRASELEKGKEKDKEKDKEKGHRDHKERLEEAMSDRIISDRVVRFLAWYDLAN